MDDSPQSKPLLLPGAMQLLPCLQGLLHGRAPDCIMCMHCPSSCKRVTGQQGCRHVPCLHDRLVEDVPNEQQRPPLCPSACRGDAGALFTAWQAGSHSCSKPSPSQPPWYGAFGHAWHNTAFPFVYGACAEGQQALRQHVCNP